MTDTQMMIVVACALFGGVLVGVVLSTFSILWGQARAEDKRNAENLKRKL